MEKEIPLFPLNIVVFPGEEVNLHIFEPRYKQLINDVLAGDEQFGIPSYVLNKIEMGTVVEVVEVTKKYSDGRMDIKTVGKELFEVIDFQNPWKDRLYAGGSVRYVYVDSREDAELKLRMKDLCSELFSWLRLEDQIAVDENLSVFNIAHKVGLKLEEEYELLKLETEKERQQYLVNHLKNILPALERAEQATERIKLNGHFKHLDPLKF